MCGILYVTCRARKVDYTRERERGTGGGGGGGAEYIPEKSYVLLN